MCPNQRQAVQETVRPPSNVWSQHAPDEIRSLGRVFSRWRARGESALLRVQERLARVLDPDQLRATRPSLFDSQTRAVARVPLAALPAQIPNVNGRDSARVPLGQLQIHLGIALAAVSDQDE